MNFKKSVLSIGLIIGMLGLTACSKSTADELQSKKWSLKSSKDTISEEAKFSKKYLTLSEMNLSEDLPYKISNKNGKEQINITDKDSYTDKKIVEIFEIKKDDDDYKLLPINQNAKDKEGVITLIPK